MGGSSRGKTTPHENTRPLTLTLTLTLAHSLHAGPPSDQPGRTVPSAVARRDSRGRTGWSFRLAALFAHPQLTTHNPQKTTRLYGLNIARSLGDRFLKDEDLGLSAEPHVSDVVTVDADREALIVIASDGLWDVMCVEDAIDMARHVDRDTRGGVVDVAVALVEEAIALGSKDDVTVAVCRVWSEDYVASFSGGFRGRRGDTQLEGDADGGEGEDENDGDDDDVDDDLAVGFGGMLL